MKVPVTVCFCINIHDSQNMETTYMSIKKWQKKCRMFTQPGKYCIQLPGTDTTIYD